MSHLPFDARSILEYLNELGYRNITAGQLKEFMKDLRKLIKYEEQLGVNINQPDQFEKLFKKTTASFRAKTDKENRKDTGVQTTQPCRKESNLDSRIKCTKSSDYVSKKKRNISNTDVDSSNLRSSNVIHSTLNEKNEKSVTEVQKNDRPRSAQDMRNILLSNSETGQAQNKENVSGEEKQRPSRSSSRSHSGNRRRSKTPSGNSKGRGNDPVELYQYYSREWKRFKNQMPGESSRSDLRWHIRCKLLKPKTCE